MGITANQNARNGRLVLCLVALVVLTACQSGPPSESYIEGLRERALAGSAAAQVRMGRLYWLGEGVPEDYEAAAKWFRLAAEQGHPQGQQALGRICYVAVVMRRKSAIEELRHQLEVKLGVAEDYSRPKAEAEWMECDVVEAYAWLSLAAAQGKRTADGKQEEIREGMTAAEIIQAQELAGELNKSIEASQSE